MDQCTHEVCAEYRKKIIKACGQRPTGQSAKKWMDKNGISEQRYYHWQRKFRQQAYDQMKENETLGVRTIHQLFGNMNEKAYTTWPMMKHCKVFLPVGWVLLYIRRVYRVMTGKRAKMNYFKVYKDSYQRKELYQQLHIFER